MKTWLLTTAYLRIDTLNDYNLTVAFCSVLKANRFCFKVTFNKVKHFLSYTIVSRNDDKGHILLSLLLFVSIESRSIVNRCIGQQSVSNGNYVHYVYSCKHMCTGK